ncbi:MAG: hypothetical protein ACOY45_06025 [Pseudomonadota bacterium]
MRFKLVAAAIALGVAAMPSIASAQVDTKKFGPWAYIKTDKSCAALYSQGSQTLFMLAGADSSGITITTDSSRRAKEDSEHKILMIFGTKETSREGNITAAKITGDAVSYFLPYKAEILGELLKLDPRFYGEENGVRVWGFEPPAADTQQAMNAFIACQKSFAG